MPPFGRPHRHFTLTDSTNERARELAQSGARGGTVVTATEQSAGRGRRERTWTAPAGKALLYSAILRPLDERHALLPLAVPLAVCEAVEAVAPVRCQVKWPNDVWIEERKVAGVLIEARPPDWAVIGIGINIAIEPEEFPTDLRWPAASVGHGATVKAALGALNDALSERVESPAAEVLDSFRDRDALAGRELSWEGAGEGTGTARGIDERGNLMVETEQGERVTLGSGEVTLRPRNL
jgi:BirA family transcriptional regulator, biotin operon repressor / biotin---[acetyl-CoA-carboxylase] ligase